LTFQKVSVQKRRTTIFKEHSRFIKDNVVESGHNYLKTFSDYDSFGRIQAYKVPLSQNRNKTLCVHNTHTKSTVIDHTITLHTLHITVTR
jgi:hypothetical protein